MFFATENQVLTPGSGTPSDHPVASDQGIRGTIMVECGFLPARKFRHDALGQGLAQFDAPLVEGVDAPNDPLGKDAVFVEGHELAQDFRGEALGE